MDDANALLEQHGLTGLDTDALTRKVTEAVLDNRMSEEDANRIAAAVPLEIRPWRFTWREGDLVQAR